MHPFERVIADTLRRFHRWRECIRKGMARAAQRGMHMDRPTGTTDDPAGLLARYPAIVVALQSGLSLRKAAAGCWRAVNTVRRGASGDYSDRCARHRSDRLAFS